MPSECFNILLVVTALLRLALGDCQSWGWDFVDGGQDYFINTLDTAPFSFGTIFEGCVPNDTEGQPVYPVVVDPFEDEYFCSGIADQPDGSVQMSTCDLPSPDGPPLCKNNMVSGTYYIVIQGTSFSWMRTFTIVAGPQTTITATPTALFNVTVTPSTTINSTITSSVNTTLVPITYNTTLPSTTITKTSTVTPPKVTVTTILTTTRSKASSMVYSKTLTTITKTLTCKTQIPKRDPTCTLNLSKASAVVGTASPTATAGRKGRKMPRPRVRDRISPRRRPGEKPSRRDLLAKRTADLPTTVIVETTYIASIYNTFTAPTSTEIDSCYTTVTSTITPPPVTSTAYSGKAKTTVTVTASKLTKMVVLHTATTVWTTETIWATVTITSKVAPNGLVCSAGATPTPTSG